MTFFRREADRLDSYLDDQVKGRSTNPDGLDPALIDTWTWAKTAMAQTPSDPDAKADTWRTLMQAQATAAALPAPVIRPAARRYDDLSKPRWSNRAMAFIGTATMVAGLAVGIAGYDRFGGGNTPGEPTSIPAASFFLPGTPEATGCDVPRREPGAIEKIMETPMTQSPYFPRLNMSRGEPIIGSSGQAVVDGTSLWFNSTEVESTPDGIQQLLDKLYDCRAYAFTQGHVDMESPYFSLFSDDYFRRELNGVVESGQPLEINAFWTPATKPVIVDVRKAMAGDRYLVTLAERFGNSDDIRVLSIVPGENNTWYVDEVGRATKPQIDALGTPIIDEAEFAAQATEYAATPVTDRYPHQLTLSVDDLAASFESRPTCDVNTAGTPVPCDFWGIFNSGPWWYNELPANLPFTLTFINTSSVTTHISSPELGFDVELAGNQQVDIDVDADPGKYAVDFVQGDLTSTWTLEFEPVDGGRFSMG